MLRDIPLACSYGSNFALPQFLGSFRHLSDPSSPNFHAPPLRLDRCLAKRSYMSSGFSDTFLTSTFTSLISFKSISILKFLSNRKINFVKLKPLDTICLTGTMVGATHLCNFENNIIDIDKYYRNFLFNYSKKIKSIVLIFLKID